MLRATTAARSIDAGHSGFGLRHVAGTAVRLHLFRDRRHAKALTHQRFAA